VNQVPVSRLPLKIRLLLYLYSLRNIVACLAALVGPALLFLGMIREGWLLITAGLYVVGYLLTPAPRHIHADLAQSLSFDALLAQLDRILKQARSQLQPEMVQRLDRIRSSIEEVRPRLEAVQGFDDDLYTVRETVARYLPETLANYLVLPSMFRMTHVLQDGKTARQLLLEQLTTLDDQMRQVVANVARGDAQALLVNGQFLQARFRRRDFIRPDHQSAA
jgi:hypothetical protein